MKKILLSLFALATLSISAQSWKYEAGGSEFDGKYKTSYVQGQGSEFPYNDPVLSINKFDKQNDINFYISNSGFYQEDTGVRIVWAVDNEPDILYYTNRFSYSSDGKTLFINGFNDPHSNGEMSKYEFITKLKTASKVSVRVSNNYGSNDLSFSLKGSTKAIEFVISKSEMDSQIKLIQAEREEENKFKEKQTILRDKLIAVADSFKIKESSRSSLLYTLEDDLGIGFSGVNHPSYTGDAYSSLIIKPEKSSVDEEMLKTGLATLFERMGSVDIFYVLEDGSEKEISGHFSVNMDSPLLADLEEQKARILNLLSKYKIEKLKNLVLAKIREKEMGNDSWTLNQVKDITLTFSDFTVGKIWKLSGFIHLENGEKISMPFLSISDLEITKRQVKDMGGKIGKEF
jgi:hypothetical protein